MLGSGLYLVPFCSPRQVVDVAKLMKAYISMIVKKRYSTTRSVSSQGSSRWRQASPCHFQIWLCPGQRQVLTQLWKHSCPGLRKPVVRGRSFRDSFPPHPLQWSRIKLSTLTVCTISKALVLIDTCLKKRKGRKPCCHQSSQKCLNLQNQP